jgi:phosphoribosylglycinamide formyltransferase-1
MKKIIVLTGSEARHSYVRKALGVCEGIEVVRSYCEETSGNITRFIESTEEGKLQQAHVDARARSEQDFFGPFVELAPDCSKPVFLPKGDINKPEHCNDILRLKPDLLLSYGCSLIRDPLLSAFSGRFINIHLGLSPYYRGSGTNFWPLVNGEPEYVGVTFMHIDAGVDTGEIIHQLRARVFPGDSPHQIGNRLIADMVSETAKILRKFETLEKLEPLPIPEIVRVCKQKDFTVDSVKRLYAAFDDGLVERYLREHSARVARVPILVQK